MINKIIKGYLLNAHTKTEPKKLMNKKVFNIKLFFENMMYLNDIETVTKTLSICTPIRRRLRARPEVAGERRSVQTPSPAPPPFAAPPGQDRSRRREA